MTSRSITIENLKVARGSFVLEVPRLDIAPREIFAVLGTTGSGKTVLLESLAGAFSFETGSILFDGSDIEGVPIQERRLGIVYQDHALFPHLSVYENIAYGLRRKRCSASDVDRLVQDMLSLFSIEHIKEKYPGVISGGESQRVALARALVLEPDVLLLDEPFSALDPATKERMYAMLREVHARFDCTIVFVTHDFHEAQTLADRVGIVLGSRLRCVVDAEQLFEGAYEDDVRYFLGC